MVIFYKKLKKNQIQLTPKNWLLQLKNEQKNVNKANLLHLYIHSLSPGWNVTMKTFKNDNCRIKI